jgi:hypothetical protein
LATHDAPADAGTVVAAMRNVMREAALAWAKPVTCRRLERVARIVCQRSGDDEFDAADVAGRILDMVTPIILLELTGKPLSKRSVGKRGGGGRGVACPACEEGGV